MYNKLTFLQVNAVRKNAVEPMVTLLKLYEGPQKLMEKRKKRVLDFARYRAMKDRGEKVDKKTMEQGEQFMAVNETLKDELPKLFVCTKKLVEACLNNFIQLQLQWQLIWRRKLSLAIDNGNIPSQLSEIVESFSGDFRYTEAQVLSLGICNGSFLSEASVGQGMSGATTLNGDASSSGRPSVSRRPSMSNDDSRYYSYSAASTTDSSRNRGVSTSSHISPMLPRPDLGRSGETFGTYLGNEASNTYAYVPPGQRLRAGSNVSASHEGGVWRSYASTSTIPTAAQIARPSTGNGRRSYDYRSGYDNTNYYHSDGQGANRPISHTAYRAPQYRTESSGAPSPTQAVHHRTSGLFSSALPMSDSPRNQSPTEEPSPRTTFNVLFLAASVYEFNIDRARREAGYPYLTYAAGEIFDVIGEKGELWLAKNQDDRSNTLGWIWNKHFAKLAS